MSREGNRPPTLQKDMRGGRKSVRLGGSMTQLEPLIRMLLLLQIILGDETFWREVCSTIGCPPAPSLWPLLSAAESSTNREQESIHVCLLSVTLKAYGLYCLIAGLINIKPHAIHKERERDQREAIPRG